MSIKTFRYEIVGFEGDPREIKARWITLADRCREIVNMIWQEWECWHVANGSHAKCLEFAKKLRAFRTEENDRKSGKSQSQEELVKPKLDVNAFPDELGKSLYAKIAARYRDVPTRMVTTIQGSTRSKIITGKDVDGVWNVWLSILLNRQGRPNCTKDQPIPFDGKVSRTFTEIKGKFTNYGLAVKISRDEHADKNLLIEDRCQLKARGSGLAIMQRIVSGEYLFKNSSIVYMASKGKWFALICYDDQRGENTMCGASGTAILHPLQDSPWCLWWKGNWKWFGGRGQYIARQRHDLLTGRWSRQDGYRYAGSANKGHGRKRALQGVKRLSKCWKDFTKTCNHTLTTEVVDFCVQNKIARLVYLQPMGNKRETRFLTTAGKVPGRIDSTGWDWAQVASLLEYKCNHFGVHFELNKCEANGKKIDPKKAKKKVRSPRKKAAARNGDIEALA